MIEITAKNGYKYVVSNNNLIEANGIGFENLFPIEYSGDVSVFLKAENFNTHSGTDYKGINVGFKLEYLRISDLTKVEVSLYDGNTLLVKNTANDKFFNLPDTIKQHSTPFIISEGTYTEEYWNLGRY